MPFIEILDAASPRAFTTLADVKAALGITVTTFDVEIARLIESVSSLIENVTGKVWAADRVRERVAGHGDLYLMLDRRPILSVDSVTLDGSTIAPSAYLINAEAGALFNANGWRYTGLYGGLAELPMPGSGAPLYVVEYTGGHIMPGTMDGATPVASTLPKALQDIAIRGIHLYLAPKLAGDGETRDPTIKAERLGDASITYAVADGGDGLTPDGMIRAWLEAGRWISAPFVS